MRNKSKGGKIAMMIVLGIGAIFLFGFIVMSLWNAILVPVLGIGTVSFWQALGILVLSKILFGGFKGRGGFGGGPPAWKNEMREKWQHMTPAEREQVKQQWRDKCRSWGRRTYSETSKPDITPNSPVNE